MSSIEKLLGPHRAWQLEVIATRTANLRLMAITGGVITLTEALISKLPAARTGFRSFEVELGGLKLPNGDWSDKTKAEQVLARRTQLLAEITAAAKAASEKANSLAEITKKAHAALHEGMTQVDRTLKSSENLLIALEKNPGECASTAVEELIRPLTELIPQLEKLRDDARAETGYKFNWRMVRNAFTLGASCLTASAIAFWAVWPAIIFAFGGHAAQVPEFIGAIGGILLFFSTIIGGIVTVLAVPTMIYDERKRMKQAEAIISTGQLPTFYEEQARDADESFQILSRVQACLSDPAAAAATS